MPLSPKARRAAAELETAIADGNAQHVLSLVDNYGLSRGDRIAVASELDRRVRAPDPERALLTFGAFDQARTVGDIWHT